MAEIVYFQPRHVNVCHYGDPIGAAYDRPYPIGGFDAALEFWADRSCAQTPLDFIQELVDVGYNEDKAISVTLAALIHRKLSQGGI